MAQDITRKILKTINEVKNANSNPKPELKEPQIIENDNFLTRAKVLMEEAESNIKKNSINEEVKEGKENAIPITKKTPNFGDVRTAQEEAILKTIGQQVKFKEDALLYYPEEEDLVINGEIPSMNTTFQFRFNDSSGNGCYLFCDGLQLTDENARTVGKIKDAFMNFRQNLIDDNDLLSKLKKVSERDK